MIVGHGFVGSAVASLFSEKEKVIVVFGSLYLAGNALSLN